MGELKPCPFCHGKAEIETQPQGMSSVIWNVYCIECVASVYGTTKENAVKAWNKRPGCDNCGEALTRCRTCDPTVHEITSDQIIELNEKDTAKASVKDLYAMTNVEEFIDEKQELIAKTICYCAKQIKKKYKIRRGDE